MSETETIKTSVRLPADMHARLKVEAALQGRTPHNLLINYVRRGLQEDEQGREQS